LTLLVSIIKMIEQGLRASEIAKILDLDKQLVSYHIRKLKQRGYVKEIVRDAFKVLEVTQAGKNFLDQYTNPTDDTYICRLENVRFKAIVHRMPTLAIDWKKTEMTNWTQYGSEIDNITVHLNTGKIPTIEFLPSPVDGHNPYILYAMALYDCHKAAEKLEGTLGMEIGRLEPSSSAEWVVYDPVAKAFSKHMGQVTVEGIGKVNASGPSRRGEFEFHDPRAAADYMAMPRRLHNVEQQLQNVQKMNEEILKLIKEKQSDSHNYNYKSEQE
jgi:DNA-binding MarR family transcriptional regulator